MKKIKANLLNGIVTSNESLAFSLYEKSVFGEKIGGKIQYSLPETLYLVEKKKIEVYSKNKKIDFEPLLNKFKKVDNRILIKYYVYRDLREKGYIVKTALKFGAEFRVYDKGVKPGQKGKHARWIVFTEKETNKISWYEFAAKNRVAHSTRKKLLLAIIDEEGDISYYEVNWIKP